VSPYNGKYLWYNYDMRGSVTNLIDPDDGQSVKDYSYDEFGNVTESGSGVNNELKYTGSVHDSRSGLNYMNARYYSATTGRFLQQDTYSGNAFQPWTQHLYSYCYNSPTNCVDPTGHDPDNNGSVGYLRWYESNAEPRVIEQQTKQRIKNKFGGTTLSEWLTGLDDQLVERTINEFETSCFVDQYLQTFRGNI
jgi:RHS repeat-associated protein